MSKNKKSNEVVAVESVVETSASIESVVDEVVVEAKPKRVRKAQAPKEVTDLTVEDILNEAPEASTDDVVEPSKVEQRLLATQRDYILHSGPTGYSTVESKPRTMKELLVECNLDWTVSAEPIHNPKGEVTTDIYRQVMRSDNDQVLGVVGSRWTAIQNEEALSWADELVGGSGGGTYEAGWSDPTGSQVGFTMQLPKGVSIGGHDETGCYVIGRNVHSGTGSVSVIITPVRLRCTNMIRLAQSNALQVIRVPHVSNYKERMQVATQILQASDAFMDEYKKEMERLLMLQVTTDQARAIFEASFDNKSQVETAMLALATSITLDDDMRGTGYGVLQASTETTQHLVGRGRGIGRSLDTLWTGHTERQSRATHRALLAL